MRVKPTFLIFLEPPAAFRGPPGDAISFVYFLVRAEFCDICVVRINFVCVYKCIERRKTVVN